MRFVTTLAIVASLTSCGGQKSNSSQDSNAKSPNKKTQKTEKVETNFINEDFSAKVENKVELKKDFSNFKEFNSGTNEFILTITSKQPLPEDTQVYCYTKEPLATSRELKGVFNRENKSSIIPFDILGNSIYSADYHCKISHQNRTLGEIDFTAYMTILVSNEYSISKLSLNGSRKIKSLVLTKDAILHTDGRKMELIADEIISESATITTFYNREDLTAKNDTHGKSPEPISIIANKAMGKINFEMRGQNAGKNTFVPKAITKKRKNARNGSKTEANDGSCDGGDALNGFQGTSGTVGYNGGNSGSLLLKIKDISSFDFALTFTPGNGGLGGNGGKGGPAGRPGKAGSRRGTYQQFYDCKAGRPGKDGAIGKTGNTGLDGRRDTTTLISGSEQEITYFDDSFQSFNKERR